MYGWGISDLVINCLKTKLKTKIKKKNRNF